MKIFYSGKDCGDGSLAVEFFDSQETIDLLEEHDCEGYRGEGGGCFEVPDGTVITGLDITTYEDARVYLIEYGYLREE